MNQKRINIALAIGAALALVSLVLGVSTSNRLNSFQIVGVGTQSIAPNYFRQVVVVGGADSVPLSVTGYTTQTNPLFSLNNVTGTSVFSVTNTGAAGLGAGGITWSSVDKTGSSLADLTTRSAASLSSGTLADARLSSNVPLLNAPATFTDVVTSTQGFVGNLTGDVTGNVTGNLTGIVTGSNVSIGLGSYLSLIPAPVLTVTNGAGFSLLGSYQPITAATAVTPLLNAAPAVGSIVIIENESPNTVTLVTTAGIQKFATIQLLQYETLCLISDGTNYLNCTK